MGRWWQDAVVYQIYPRSFQDSGGDGIGDLPGITSRLDHLAELGVDALWLSPIYPSPMADGGYDVADYCAVHPALGSPADFDALVARAHELGLHVLLDIVPCHTSIEHPWFREYPERYVIRETERPPNNWRATFGGPAWSRDPYGRGWYLHSFYPEQPDLDWRNPEVRDAVADVLRFWLARGVDGFRLDALQQLMKDAELRDDAPALARFALPLGDEYATLAHDRSGNAPDVGIALAALRAAARDRFLVGEVFLPTAGLGNYLEHLDAAFCFELLFAPWEAETLAGVIRGALGQWRPDAQVAWVLSNHDFPRLVSRVGAAHARAAALLLLTLPGVAFVYQGDEIGMANGPGGGDPPDRFGRDAFRHPMQWDAAPHGGFTTGRPWLAPVDPERRNVAAQREDPESVLSLYRRLIAVRRSELSGPVEDLAARDGVLSFRRGACIVAVNTASSQRPAPQAGTILVGTGGAGAAELPPGAAFVARA